MTEESGIVVHLKKEHARLMREIRGITAALAAFGAAYGNGTEGTNRMSAAARARISKAQKARWAESRKNGGQEKGTTTKKKTVSVAARKKMAASQKARWAKVRAAQKKSA
jgi:nucleoid-associated protein YgaU